MELNGQLRGFELVDLLQMLGLGRKTGTLLVRRLDEWLALVIEDGKLTRILSQAIPYESFGEVLVELGILDDEGISGVLEMQQKGSPGRRLGEIMKDYGLNRDSVEETLFYQVRSLLAQILSWQDGSFSLHLGSVPSENLPQEVRQIKFDQPLAVLDLLLMAWQEVDESQQKHYGENTQGEVTTMEAPILENLITRLARIEEMINRGEETNARVRLSTVRSFMSELSACNSQREVMVMLLRAAGEVAGRGFLIQMDDGELYDLGHYDSVPSSDCDSEDIPSADEMISVEPECINSSILGSARAAGHPIVINWSDASNGNEANHWLMARLGSQISPNVRAFLIPVQSDGSTLILYGDDATWPIDLEQLGELEIILYQAVLTMERLRFDRVCTLMTHNYYQAA